jgi:peptide/nickel transport system permease protein
MGRSAHQNRHGVKRLAQMIRKLPGWSSGMAARVSWVALGAMALLAVFGPLIANERPYLCVLDGKTYFPLFTGITEAELSVRHPAHSPVDWHETAFVRIWRAPVPFSYNTIDLDAGTFVPPGASAASLRGATHWLGTDSLGRDVLAGMVRGCRVSLVIGFGAMLLALLLGVPLGAVAGYAGNAGWRMTWGQLILVVMLAAAGIIVGYSPLRSGLKIVVQGLVAGIAIGILLLRKPVERGGAAFPADRAVMALISILDGFPGLFLILIVLAVLPVQGWLAVTLVLAGLRWPVMARYMRAEVLKARSMPHIQSAKLLNLPDRRILWAHIVPYALRPVLVSFIFGVASAIVAESSLSYLGIGLAADELNWGRLLAQARNHGDAWWLVVFPGAAISMTLIALHVIAEAWERETVNG